MPVTDLGNLLRFERDPVLAEAVLGVYMDRVPDAADDTLDLARAADLSPWSTSPHDGARTR